MPESSEISLDEGSRRASQAGGNLFDSGVAVLKHGRRGRPKKRTLFTFESTEGPAIAWRTSKLLRSGPRDASGRSIEVLPFKSIVDVVQGCQTNILKRSAAGKDDVCMSIVGVSRTLDVELPSKLDRDHLMQEVRAVMRRSSMLYSGDEEFLI